MLRFGHMEIELAFGKTGLRVALPDGVRYRVLEARSAQAVENPQAAIEQALDAPVEAPPIEELARGKRSAAISVCDITRPAPNRVVLPPLLKRLEKAGIPRDRITILIATGLHRPATAEEIHQIVGPEIESAYRIENHHARELSEHRFLGKTAAGTPVYIDERFVSADLRITTGFIEPHFMLGFSGGRKLIVPGIAAKETIQAIHGPGFMANPKSIEGSIEDNPLHTELVEIARMAGHDFVIDTSLTRDRRIAGVFAGHPEKAHRKGVEFVSKVMLETLDEPVDAVITTAAGYPLDLTFYQAIKGVTAASQIVKPGGTILLFAECAEGPGAAEFSSMLNRFSSAGEFLDHIAKAPVEVDQWNLQKLAQVRKKAEILFYVPGVPSEYYPTFWGKTYTSAAEAVSALLARVPKDASVAVIPEGPYVLAKARAANS
ncbi:MAG: nickel-dependent lactate racemase [Bryobacteraceae bacterium]